MDAYLWTEKNGRMVEVHWQNPGEFFNRASLCFWSEVREKLAAKEDYFRGLGYVVNYFNPAFMR
jgi:hypothetical protein